MKMNKTFEQAAIDMERQDLNAFLVKNISKLGFNLPSNEVQDIDILSSYDYSYVGDESTINNDISYTEENLSISSYRSERNYSKAA